MAPCFTPLQAYRARGGAVTFQRREATGPPFDLPCGQCIGCRIERSRQWATRCVHEAQSHEVNCFVTLTYDRENLPGDLGLDVRHWQLFAKRLRKKCGPFRFFHCGEYGDENLRPHYHALLFGLDFGADRVLWKEDSEKRKTYLSPLLSERWSYGFTTVADLTWQSAAYVARYVVKKATGPLASEVYSRLNPETGEVWEVKPPYTTMSRRPGIGSDWFSKYKGDVFPGDFVVHDGRKFRPPSFYDKRLPEAELEVVKQTRKRRAAAHVAEQVPDRLRVRERIMEAKAERLCRSV